MTNSLTTYQLNPLLEAQKNFDVMETRLFYLGLQDINPHLSDKDKHYDTQLPDTYIPSCELKKIFGGYGQYLPEVKKACRRMINTSIEIHYEDGFDMYTVFQQIRYKNGDGLYIKFNECMRPFVLDIYKSYKKYGFTRIEMNQIFSLSSAYAMKLLEFLLQYRGKAKNGIIEREISVQDLRKRLNVPENTYTQMCNFKAKVLDLPINNINTNTQYVVSYESVKKGRKVAGFRFTCNCNHVPKDIDYTDTIEAAPQEVREIAAPAPEAKKEKKAAYNYALGNDAKDAADELPDEIMKKLLIYGIAENTAKTLLRKCNDIDDFLGRLEYAEDCLRNSTKNGTEIGNLAGYIRKSIEENWKGQDAAAKAAKTAQETESLMAWIDTLPDETDPDKPVKKFDTNKQFDKSRMALIRDEIKDKKIGKTALNILFYEFNMSVRKFAELYML